MYSDFKISVSDGTTCTNQSLKSLGTLRGVFGAEIDRVNGLITVNHTDEVTKNEIATRLKELGYDLTEDSFRLDDTCEWGCAL